MSQQLRKEAEKGNKDEKSQDTIDDLGCLHLQGCGMRIKKLLCVCIEPGKMSTKLIYFMKLSSE